MSLRPCLCSNLEKNGNKQFFSETIPKNVIKFKFPAKPL